MKKRLTSWPYEIPSKSHSNQEKSNQLWIDAGRPSAISVHNWFNKSNLTAATKNRTNRGLMLGDRLRRWPNIKPRMVRYGLFVGLSVRPSVRPAVVCRLGRRRHSVSYCRGLSNGMRDGIRRNQKWLPPSPHGGAARGRLFIRPNLPVTSGRRTLAHVITARLIRSVAKWKNVIISSALQINHLVDQPLIQINIRFLLPAELR